LVRVALFPPNNPVVPVIAVRFVRRSLALLVVRQFVLPVHVPLNETIVCLAEPIIGTVATTRGGRPFSCLPAVFPCLCTVLPHPAGHELDDL
jgi:hypothetical protein